MNVDNYWLERQDHLFVTYVEELVKIVGILESPLKAEMGAEF